MKQEKQATTLEGYVTVPMTAWTFHETLQRPIWHFSDLSPPIMQACAQTWGRKTDLPASTPKKTLHFACVQYYFDAVSWRFEKKHLFQT